MFPPRAAAESFAWVALTFTVWTLVVLVEVESNLLGWRGLRPEVWPKVGGLVAALGACAALSWGGRTRAGAAVGALACLGLGVGWVMTLPPPGGDLFLGQPVTPAPAGYRRALAVALLTPGGLLALRSALRGWPSAAPDA